MTFPFLLMILHLSQIFLTEGFTFTLEYRSFLGLFFPPGDTSFGEVVNRNLDRYRVTGKNLDIVHTQLARDVCGHDVAVRELYFEGCVRECFHNNAVFKFNQIVLSQNNPSSTVD